MKNSKFRLTPRERWVLKNLLLKMYHDIFTGKSPAPQEKKPSLVDLAIDNIEAFIVQQSADNSRKRAYKRLEKLISLHDTPTPANSRTIRLPKEGAETNVELDPGISKIRIDLWKGKTLFLEIGLDDVNRIELIEKQTDPSGYKKIKEAPRREIEFDKEKIDW